MPPKRVPGSIRVRNRGSREAAPRANTDLSSPIRASALRSAFTHVLYLKFLAEVHRRLDPDSYLEIGVRNGNSLALANCRAIGIDPAYRIQAELDGDVALFRTTSDEYFSRPDPLAPTSGVPFDLAFIDGLHLFEFALRDFIFAERHASARGMIIFDDVFPHRRRGRPRAAHRALDGRRLLDLGDAGAVPSGTGGGTAEHLADRFARGDRPRSDEYRAGRQLRADPGEFRQPDPQPVPSEILDRLSVFGPARFLESGVLEYLAGQPAEATPGAIGEGLRKLVSSRLGAAFVTLPERVT